MSPIQDDDDGEHGYKANRWDRPQRGGEAAAELAVLRSQVTSIERGLNSVETRISDRFRDQVENIRRDISDLRTSLKEDYVRREDYDTVKKLAHGLAAVVLVGFATALVALVTVQ